jgi:hypothetical protein
MTAGRLLIVAAQAISFGSLRDSAPLHRSRRDPSNRKISVKEGASAPCSLLLDDHSSGMPAVSRALAAS